MGRADRPAGRPHPAGPGAAASAPGRASRRRGTVLVVGLVVLVAVLGIELYRVTRPPRGGDPHNHLAALRAVRTFDYVGGQHTTRPVTYAQSPPVGGPHDPTWDDCGAYAAPVRKENAVHDLEHGTVWVTYRPGLAPADVAALQQRLQGLPSGRWMLSPYPGLRAPVVVTVWNAQLALTSADDPRLPVFLRFYGDGHTGPEAAYASCRDGAHIMASPTHP